MLKSELIALLTSLPGDPRILIDGYEGGLCDIFPGKIRFAPIVLLDINKGQHWNGPHEEVTMDEVRARLLWDDAAYESTKAFIIER